MMSTEERAPYPAIDVVVATRNSERFLEQCLGSIVAQGIPDVRITIVDASSTDGTRAIASQVAEAVVIDQTGQGLAQAWNQGIRAGTRDVIAMIDSDDYWSPDFLWASWSALQASPAAECVTAKAKFVLDAEHLPPGFRRDLVDAERIGWMPGTTVFRRSLLERVGYFPEDHQIASDIEWFARVREQSSTIVQLPMVGLYKRIHGENLSLGGTDLSVYHQELLRVARARVRRRPSSAP